MADIKISGLTNLGAVTDTSVLPITSSGTTYKVSGSTLTSYLLNKISATNASASGSGSVSFDSNTGVITFTPPAATTAGNISGTTLNSTVVTSSLTSVGTLTGLTVSGTIIRSGNISSAAWTTSGIGFKIPSATYTDTSSSGTVTNNYVNIIGIPTIASTNTTTISNAANLYIAGDPIGGANTTVASSYSLYVQGKTNFVGTVRFNGNILSGGGAAMLGFSNTVVTVWPNTASTSYTTGSLVVSGGVGIAGNVYTNGYISQAATPSFRVYGFGVTTNLTTTTNTDGKLTGANFALDYQQGGTNLVVGTGIFTAPVAGIYQVNLVARTSGSASAAQIAVVKNYAGSSSVVCMVEFGASSTMTHTGSSSSVKLAASDTLVVKVLLGSVNFDANDSWSVTFLG